MNSVTNTEKEILELVNGTRPRTTDFWETVHIETATGEYDHEKDILQTAGFNTVITAEDLGAAKHLGEWPSALGYYDERGLEFLWDYVDNTMARVPKNRMYLGWMSTSTHTPFLLSPEWRDKNFRSYVEDWSEWSSVNTWLNAVRWTDDKVKELILGFRERGLEDETLFLMYTHIRPC
jgi:phosphoglycerol transferase MdoB-like AlkP superfamily enzyme